MTPFISITSSKNKTTNTLLKAACNERGIELIEIFPSDPAEKYLTTSPHLLYRVTDDTLSQTKEKILLNKQSTSFRRSIPSPIAFPDNVIDETLCFEHHGIPIPETIIINSLDRAYIQSSVEKLHGFPIIVKLPFGSHGVGVIRADSYPSLFSIIDYVEKENKFFLLREYIHTTTSARLIVLGDSVIDSIEYIVPEGDFRSNVGDKPIVRAKKFSKEIQDIAIQSVKIAGYEFGGVDILIDQQGKGYVSEVNFPCFFPRCQNLTGTNIALQMVDHLLEKQANLS